MTREALIYWLVLAVGGNVLWVALLTLSMFRIAQLENAVFRRSTRFADLANELHAMTVKYNEAQCRYEAELQRRPPPKPVGDIGFDANGSEVT